ncbi:cupin domain-containing protein [Thermodesulfobacterium hydrogeniphilum]|uniref:cupin domain-containing protein n=1 Tax=Thermodesulfobacterium hydrogeniphilum TaxID=161156 RepID=UPI000571E7A8|nr:cupin domain-containing protein [Thermodesulfobacterium hydrogeniphilum]
MGFLINLKEVEMKDHPKFKGVKIGFIVTKEKQPELSITVLEIQPGVEISVHTHEKEVDTIFVLEGEGEIYLNKEWQELKKEDIIVVSPKEEHGVRVKGNKPMKCYIVHAPALW